MNKYIELARSIRLRINPVYAAQIGTESYERRECAEAIEDLVQQLNAVESQRVDLLFALAIANAQAREPAPKHEWVSLTSDQIDEKQWVQSGGTFNDFARAIEAKLKELNT